jgi:hypothetical protein
MAEEFALREPPRIDIGSVLGDTFALIGSQAAAVFGIALITTLPTRLLVVTDYGTAPGDFRSHWGIYLIILALWAIVAAVMATFGQGALVELAAAKRRNMPFGFLDALAAALKRLPVLIPVAALYLLGVLFGMVFLIVPGFIAATMWSVTGPVAVAERTGIIETFRRSQTLTNNTLWEIFLLMLAATVVVGVFSWITGELGLLLLGPNADELSPAVQPSAFLFQTLVDTLKAGFSLALSCSLYLALIEREGGGPMSDRLTEIFR